jgi:hypothetical protein
VDSRGASGGAFDPERVLAALDSAMLKQDEERS